MEIKTLSDVCLINMGQSPDSASYNDKKDGLAFYQGNADFGEIHPTTRVWCNNPIKIAEKDDILISVRAPIGSMNIANEKCCIGRGLASIKPFDESVCDRNYLYHFLESKVPYMQSKGTGSTFKAINKGILTNLQIKLPNIDEQHKISAIISKIKRQIHNKNKILKKYDELVKSQFIEMFRCCKNTTLSNIAKITMGQSPDSASYNDNQDGMPFFQGKADFGDKYTKVKHYTTQPTKIAEQNDVLMSVRAPVGPVNVASVKCCIGRGLASIRPIENKSTTEFLYCMLKSKESELAEKGTGSTFKAINKDVLINLVVPEADQELQKQFTNFVKHIDKLKFTIKQSIEKLNLCYQSLMKEYFE